jgi:hypothetical protein
MFVSLKGIIKKSLNFKEIKNIIKKLKSVLEAT